MHITISMYTVYILFSRENEKIYIGHTTNLIKRFYYHNVYGRQRWTLQYRPWAVIYVEVHASKEAALKREWVLKSGKGRAWIWSKIQKEYYELGYITT